MEIEVIGQITNIEIIAVGNKIRILPFLYRNFGTRYKGSILPFVRRKFRWRKLKGVPQVKLNNGEIRLAEIHWFETRGVGEIYLRIKNYLY